MNKSELTVFYSSRTENDIVYDEYERKLENKNNIVHEFVNNGDMSLAETYNFAINNCDTRYLLLVHDDLIFPKHYDTKILNNFKENPDYGILGLAGTTKLDKTGIWWNCTNNLVGKVWHRKKTKKGFQSYPTKYCELDMPIYTVAAIDGLFIAIDLEQLKAKFDERFKGFHFYDIPFCISNVTHEVKIGVVSNIKVIHKSIGETNDEWADNRKLFSELYNDYLPFEIVNKNLLVDVNVEKQHKGIRISNEKHVKVIIPSKDNYDMLTICIDSIIEKTFLSNYSIYVVDTGSDEEVLEKLRKDKRFNLIEKNYYHYAKIHNEVVNEIGEEDDILVFCNDDIVLLNDCVSKMYLQFVNNKNVGTVGAKLFYPNGLIQHGGITLNFNARDKKLDITHKGLKGQYGVNNKTKKGILGNTAALMLTSLKNYNELEGLNEETSECFEDVLYNFKCIVKGKQNIFCGNAHAIHYESMSRKKDIMKTQRENVDYKTLVLPYIQKHFSIFKKFIKPV